MLKHLQPDSARSMQHIIRTRYSENCVRYQLDVKDFYMQGDARTLSRFAFKHIRHPKARADLTDVLEYIMATQYIYDPFQQKF